MRAPRVRAAARLFGLSLLAVAAGVAGCGTSSSAARGGEARGAGSVATESGAEGAQATDFTLRDLEGRTVRLSDHLGKDVILLNFWSTWCVPCGAELPLLDNIFRANKDKGFVVLGIAMDGPESVAQVAVHARRYALTYPVLLDEETKVVGVYNPKRTAPMNILIDRKGVISRVRSGYNSGDDKLIATDIENLLK